MRARLTFDTLAYANRLKAAGVESKLAEAQAEANADMMANLVDNTLATKADLQHEVRKIEERITTLQSTLQSELERQILATQLMLTQLRSDFELRMLELRSSSAQSMKDLETRLTLRLGGIVVGGLAVISTIFSLLRVIH